MSVSLTTPNFTNFGQTLEDERHGQASEQANQIHGDAVLKKAKFVSSHEKRREMNRADRKSQVRQCLGFCLAVS